MTLNAKFWFKLIAVAFLKVTRIGFKKIGYPSNTLFEIWPALIWAVTLRHSSMLYNVLIDVLFSGSASGA